MPAGPAKTLSPRAALVHRLATSLGFAMVGIAPALPSDRAAELRRWLDAGKHGDMDYLARYADVMVDPCKIVPDAKAIICVADRYGDPREQAKEREREASQPPDAEHAAHSSDTRHPTPKTRSAPAGRIARYAQGDDYHRVIKNRLHQLADSLREQFPEHLFRTTVDTAPLMEREHAARAGLGWIGKHTLLIHPQIGSWFLLGEIITTLPLETSAEAGYPAPTIAPADHCGTCTRCIDACPTQCITPYSVDASRCISYLTIEHRGEIADELKPMMGDWVAGCDVCQEVCPYNAARAGIPNINSEINPRYEPRLVSLPVHEVLAWTEDDRRDALTRSPLKRIKLEMFKRNAEIVAANASSDKPT